MAFNAVGPYKSGVWLVSQNGKGAIVTRPHLPRSGQDWQYYWLGSTPQQAQSRLNRALGELNVVTDTIPTDLSKAFKTGVQNLSFDSLQPFLPPGQAPSSTSGYAKGIAGAGGAASGTVHDTASGIAGAITSVEDFLSFISWIFHPLNMLRAVEFVSGVAWMLMGIYIILRVSMRSGRTHRAGLSRAFPVLRARRGGRRQGRIDAAYNESRREAIRVTRDVS